MTVTAHSTSERVAYGLRQWMEARFNRYVIAANDARYKAGLTEDLSVYPAEDLYPDEDLLPYGDVPAETPYEAPVVKKFAVKSYIPDNGPFPYMMVNIDSCDIAESANGAYLVTVRASVNIAVNDNKADQANFAIMRYMDAMIDAIHNNAPSGLNGIADSVALEAIDKGELPSAGKGFMIATLVCTKEISRYE